MTPAERLIARLREQTELPERVGFRRTYAGTWQRRRGAWSWYLIDQDGYELNVGSQWPVKVLLARGFTVSKQWDSRDRWLDPLDEEATP